MTGEKPQLRVVRGNPTPEELAAVLAVLSAVTAAGQKPAPRKRSRWADPANRLRQPLRPGPDGWQRSGLPYP